MPQSQTMAKSRFVLTEEVKEVSSSTLHCRCFRDCSLLLRSTIPPSRMALRSWARSPDIKPFLVCNEFSRDCVHPTNHVFMRLSVESVESEENISLEGWVDCNVRKNEKQHLDYGPLIPSRRPSPTTQRRSTHLLLSRRRRRRLPPS